jgi:uncharacterized protein (DUF1800 family)
MDNGKSIPYASRTWIALITLMLGFMTACQVSAVVDEPPPAPATEDDTLFSSGLFYTYYNGRFANLPDFDNLTPAGYGVSAGFDLETIPLVDDFALLYQGLVHLAQSGEYSFYTRSDDGSALYLNEQQVVTNDGRHSMRTRWSEPLILEAGDYPIRASFFEAQGDQGLEIGYTGPDGETHVIEPNALWFDTALMPEPLSPENVEQATYPGISYRYFAGIWDQLPDFGVLEPAYLGIAEAFDTTPALDDNQYGLRFQAYLEIPEDGIYSFTTRSDDSSALYIGNQKVVDNDGKHGSRERTGSLALAAGSHRITVDYFERWGEEALSVEWSGPGFQRGPIPSSSLRYAFDMLPPMLEPVMPRETLLPGLAYRYAEGRWDGMPDLDLEPVIDHGVVANANLEPRLTNDHYAFSYRGFIELPVDGIYAFILNCGAAAAIWIGDRQVAARERLWGGNSEQIGAIPVKAGLHPIRIDYFERGGPDQLSVLYQPPGTQAPRPLPFTALHHLQSQLPDYLMGDTPSAPISPGLAYTYFEGTWQALADMQPAAVRAHGVVDGISLEPRADDNQFGFVFDGWLRIDEPGFHRFFLNSDDGSALWIDGQKILDNDGLHGSREVYGSVGLDAGLHPMRVGYFNRWGKQTLSLRHAPPGVLNASEIHPSILLHDTDQLPALMEALHEDPDQRAGLAYAFTTGKFDSPPDFNTLEPELFGAVADLDLSVAATDTRFAMRFSGRIRVPQDGFYRFFARADDGLSLRIAGTDVLAITGNHDNFGSLGLEAGLHEFELVFFQRWGDRHIELSWQLPDGTIEPIPTAAYLYGANDLPALTPAITPTQTPQPGLAYRQYQGSWKVLPEFDELTPTTIGLSPEVGLAQATAEHKFGLRFDGYLRVPEDGFYRFHLTSDDGSKLWLGDRLLVDNDGRHGPGAGIGGIGLAAGLHPVRIEFFQDWGGQILELELTLPDHSRAPVAATNLFHFPDQLPALLESVAPPVQSIPGLVSELYLGEWQAMPDFASLNADGIGIAASFDLAEIAQTQRFAVRYRGYLQVGRDGWYDFFVGSDDGSRLLIGDTLVVDNDGQHSMREKVGSIGLEAGWHPIEVDFFQRYGDQQLSVEVRGPDARRRPIAREQLLLDFTWLPELKDADANPAALVSGVNYAYYEGNWRQLPDFDTLEPVAEGTLDSFSLEPRLRDDQYGFRFDAYIDIPEYGFYQFCTRSDDGSRLYIGDRLVVDNDGLHSARERCGRIGLDRGRHALKVTFFERRGYDSLEVSYAGPRFGKTVIAGDLVFRLDPNGDGDPGEPADGGPLSTLDNSDPVAVADRASTGIGQGQFIVIDVLGNDSDPNGDILVLNDAYSADASGAAVIHADGRRLLYTPALGFVGTDDVEYQVGDRRGGSAIGHVEIAVSTQGLAPVMTVEDATRFLTQASFGPSKADIADLMQTGPEVWIERQLDASRTPVSGHQALFEQLRQSAPDADNRQLRIDAWLHHAVAAPDQLRQRMAFALSQIFVISDLDNVLSTDDGALGALHYYDMLVDGAFGRYRDLLEQVTLHPAMGFYLDMAGNKKADPVLGTVPDENYAREILQLFSIGLWQLQADGEPLLNQQGEPIPAYSEQDLMQYARVFTGWDYALPSGADKWRLPMLLDPNEHEDGPKRLLGGELIPANLGGQEDLARALDNIASHPNVAPFISRQLIQRFVTSNPSPDYIGRVTAAFENSDGNLGETIKAVLLDQEARTGSPDPLDAMAPAAANDDPSSPSPTSYAFGKIKEPLLQLTGLWRALGVDVEQIRLRPEHLSPLGQVPLAAPSVFNFFQPDFQNPGEIADLGLYSPELEMIDETQITGAVSLMDSWTLGATQADANYYDLTMEQAMADSSLAKIIQHLDMLLLNGRMTQSMRAVLEEQIFNDYARQGENGRLTRILAAVYLIVTSSEYLIEE